MSLKGVTKLNFENANVCDSFFLNSIKTLTRSLILSLRTPSLIGTFSILD